MKKTLQALGLMAGFLIIIYFCFVGTMLWGPWIPTILVLIGLYCLCRVLVVAK